MNLLDKLVAVVFALLAVVGSGAALMAMPWLTLGILAGLAVLAMICARGMKDRAAARRQD